MARSKKQHWQFFRCFYMKGCLFRIKGCLQGLIYSKYLTPYEKHCIVNIIKSINCMLESYNENSENLKP